MNKIKIVMLSALITFGSLTAIAQTIVIDTTQISFENKLRPAIGANVDPEPKSLKKAWASYLKKNYDVKMKGIGLLSNKDLLKAEDVTMNVVSSKRMNLYTRITETSNGSEIKVFASYGYDIFIGVKNYPKEYEALQTVFNNFLLQNLNDYYSDEIKATSKRISSLKKEKVKLQKSVAKNEKKIKKLEEDIALASATDKLTTEEKIKETEKTNKLNDTKTKLENDNRTSTATLPQIDEKLVLKKAKLDKLKLKHDNLTK